MTTVKKETPTTGLSPTPQVKICGLTRVDEALQCANLGADAIGCVFYPKSPRHVTEAQAAAISQALPQAVKTVGVFVNATFSGIMQKVARCGLQGVQLHGQEPPELVEQLMDENLLVIKALFTHRRPTWEEAAAYSASAFLIECGQGVLPGGNARTWNWESVKPFGTDHPFILAGGLAPDNVRYAASVSHPDGVDVSSGVEDTPGRKDLAKVRSFLEALSGSQIKPKLRRIF